MWNLIKIGVGIIILIFVIKLALPIVPELYRTLKVQTLSDIANYNDQKEKELLTTNQPQFDLSEVTQLLEMATEKQTISVSIDTIVDVTKTYRSAILETVGYNKSVWTKQTKARAKRTYSFEIKAGYNFKRSRVKPQSQYAMDSLFIYLPRAEILSVESNINQFRNDVTENEMSYSIYTNNQYISVNQNNEIYAMAKKISIQKAISEGILNIAETKGKYELKQFFLKVNPLINISIEIN